MIVLIWREGSKKNFNTNMNFYVIVVLKEHVGGLYRGPYGGES